MGYEICSVGFSVEVEDEDETHKILLKTNDILDQQNLMLEQEVAKKTANLSQAMMDLQQQKYELEKQKLVLTEEVDLRRHTEEELLTKQKAKKCRLQSSV